MDLKAKLAGYLRYARLKILATFLRFSVGLAWRFNPPPRLLLPESTNVTPTWTTTILSPTTGRAIKVNVHEPAHPVPERGNVPPVHISFHGSGYVLPQLGSDAEHCAYLANTVGCIVVDGDYIKAPEHPFPAAWEDVMDVLSWVQSNPKQLWDPTRITIGGYSAGANLALSVTAATLPRGGGAPKDNIKAVVAWYPPVDFTRTYLPPEQRWYQPWTKEHAGIPVGANDAIFFNECYIPPGVDPKDPRLSPIFANLEGFPPTLVIGGDSDILCKEGEDFAYALKKAGAQCEHILVKDAGHVWERVYKKGDAKYETAKEETFDKIVKLLLKAYE